MTVEAEVVLPITLTEQEYRFIVILRDFDTLDRVRLLQIAEEMRTGAQGISGQKFIQDLNTLRASLDDDEFQVFKQSLKVFDQIDPEAWE